MVYRVLINSLRQLSFAKLLQVLRLVGSHPLFALLSLHATVRAFVLAKHHYPLSHSTDGPGNAFRHALWCCLILMYCCKVSSPRKSLEWCKRMTDMHEELFPNQPLQKKMDLHNNKIGMNLFMSMLPGIHRQFFETSFFIDLLIEKTKQAVLVSDLNFDAGEHLMILEE